MHLEEAFDIEMGFLNSWMMMESLDKMEIWEKKVERNNKKGNDRKQMLAEVDFV